MGSPPVFLLRTPCYVGVHGSSTDARVPCLSLLRNWSHRVHWMDLGQVTFGSLPVLVSHKPVGRASGPGLTPPRPSRQTSMSDTLPGPPGRHQGERLHWRTESAHLPICPCPAVGPVYSLDLGEEPGPPPFLEPPPHLALGLSRFHQDLAVSLFSLLRFLVFALSLIPLLQPSVSQPFLNAP